MESLEKDARACLRFLMANRSQWEIPGDGEASGKNGAEGGMAYPPPSANNTKPLRIA